jgi:hypothetical protein
VGMFVYSSDQCDIFNRVPGHHAKMIRFRFHESRPNKERSK